MSQAYLDSGLFPSNGFISASPSYVPEFILAAPGGSSTANSLWVSVGGSDANVGSILAPFATLTAAIAKRLTLSNADVVTINMLSGTYTYLAIVTVPDNTAIVGIPAGFTSQYLVTQGQAIKGASPVTLNGRLALGSNVVSGGRVVLSGLNINGEVGVVGAASATFLYSCNIDNNNGATSIYSGSAFTTVANTRCYVDNCSLTTNAFLIPVVISAGIVLNLTSCKVAQVFTGTSSQPCAPVIRSIAQFLNVSSCSVFTNYNSTTNNAPLISMPAGGAPNVTATIDNSTLSYTSTAADPLKICFAVSSGTVSLLVTNSALLQPGGSSSVIDTAGGGTLSVTFGGVQCFSGKSTINAGGGGTKTALVLGA
jgi:hypothetical protein